MSLGRAGVSVQFGACVGKIISPQSIAIGVAAVGIRGGVEAQLMKFGVKIYIPLCKKKVLIDGAEPNPDWAYENVKSKFEVFKRALDLYYKGDWKEARVLFKESELSVGQEFIDRIGKKNAPENWSGIWTMTSK